MPFPEFLEELRSHPHPEIQNLIVLSSVESTNQIAKTILAAGEANDGPPKGPLLVVAWEQTRGRGRRGRSWSSPAGRGVYASLMLLLAEDRELAALPMLTGVGLCRSLDRYLGEGVCRLKWPNDLLVGGRKMGGILIETRSLARGGLGAVVGWGINHGQRPEELPDSDTTTLCRELDPCPSLAEVIWRTASAILAELDRRGELDNAIEAYGAHTVHQEGEAMRFKEGQGEVEGLFRGFDERGFLRLEVAGKIRLIGVGDLF